MRLWLDDVRGMRPGFTHHATTAAEAIELLATGAVEHISLDHDLAPDHYNEANFGAEPSCDGTGYEVACWIEQAVIEGRIAMPTWAVHSMNPAGAERIRQAMSNADRHWHKRRREGLSPTLPASGEEGR